MSDGEVKNIINRFVTHWHQQQNCHRQKELCTLNLTFDSLCQREHHKQQSDNTVKTSWRQSIQFANKTKQNCRENQHKQLFEAEMRVLRPIRRYWLNGKNKRTHRWSQYYLTSTTSALFFASLSPFALSFSFGLMLLLPLPPPLSLLSFFGLHIFPLLLFLLFLLVHIFTSSFQSAKWFNGCKQRLFLLEWVCVREYTSSQAYVSIRFVSILCIVMKWLAECARWICVHP